MNQLQKIAIAFVMAVASCGAIAGTVYSSGDNCEAAAQAQLAEQYEPTMRAKGYSDERIKGLKLTPLEADGCHLMDTAVGKKWVFLKKSTPMLTQGAKVVMLAECQNTIYESRYIQPKPQQAAVVPGTVTIQVNKIIQRDEITVETVIKHVEICDDTTARPKMINGQLRCPEVTVHVPVNIVPDVKVSPQVAMLPPKVTQASAPVTETCTDCTPRRKTEVGNGGNCRFKVPGNRSSIECNFEWKVLKTQDQVANCGCQLLVPSTRQIIGFLDAQPGSARCLQQKKIWTEALGLRYSDQRPPQ